MESRIWNKSRIWNTFAADRVIFHMRGFTVLQRLCEYVILPYKMKIQTHNKIKTQIKFSTFYKNGKNSDMDWEQHIKMDNDKI